MCPKCIQHNRLRLVLTCWTANRTRQPILPATRQIRALETDAWWDSGHDMVTDAWWDSGARHGDRYLVDIAGTTGGQVPGGILRAPVPIDENKAKHDDCTRNSRIA